MHLSTTRKHVNALPRKMQNSLISSKLYVVSIMWMMLKTASYYAVKNLEFQASDVT